MSSPFGLEPGTPVVVFLREPKEKIWGLLLEVSSAGVTLRGLDVRSFDEWVRQEKRDDEALLGLMTIFFPIGRLDRLERDETIGPVSSYSDRLAFETGRSVWQLVGWAPVASRSKRSTPARPRRSRGRSQAGAK